MDRTKDYSGTYDVHHFETIVRRSKVGVVCYYSKDRSYRKVVGQRSFCNYP